MAVELDQGVIDRIFTLFAGKAASIKTDMNQMTFTFTADDLPQDVDTININVDKLSSNSNVLREVIPFKISEYDLSLVKAGGWVDYADQNY